MKFSASVGALGFFPFVVCSGEEGFEGHPSFLLSGQTFPGFAVINKKAGLVFNLEGDADGFF